MNTTVKTDVIIIGAGPTGLSLACQLIRYGIDFVIIDLNEGVTPFSKALGVHARTLEIYEQMDLARSAVSQGTIAGKVRLLEGGEMRGEVDLSSIGQGMTTYPYMLVLEQSRNERLLYDYLLKHGKNVLWQTELEDFSQTDAGVTTRMKDKDSVGSLQTIEAKYLAGCDGPKSPVRHGLGLSFEGGTFERLFYVADVEIDWNFSHDALHVCLTRNSFVAFFPMPNGPQEKNRYRIVGAFPEGFDKDAGKDEGKDEGDVVYEVIERRIREETEIDLQISRVNWFSTYKVHSRHVERFSKGRCFLAGDSAHVHTPAGGQGMNTGIQDAYNLAWKLAFVLKENASEQILESYNHERLENAKRLLQTTDRMFSIAAGSDWLLNLIRTTIVPPLAGYILSLDAVKERFFPLISQIGISYRDSPLSRHGGDDPFSDDFVVKAGDRMPYFLLDGRSIFDCLREPKFHLITFSDGLADYEAMEKEVASDFSQIVDYHVIPLYPHVVEVFGMDKPFNVLLRPDNHIGYVSSNTSPEALKSYLREVIGLS